MTKPKAATDNKGIVGFRPDASLRETLQRHADDKGHSIHEEARERVISTLGKHEQPPASPEAKRLEDALRLLDEKLTLLAKNTDAENPDFRRMEDRLHLVNEKVNLVAKDMATIAFLFLTRDQPMDPKAAKAWVETNIASFKIGQISHTS
jgi:hypothetical protein